jgi:hypothetical protein
LALLEIWGFAIKILVELTTGPDFIVHEIGWTFLSLISKFQFSKKVVWVQACPQVAHRARIPDKHLWKAHVRHIADTDLDWKEDLIVSAHPGLSKSS